MEDYEDKSLKIWDDAFESAHTYSVRYIVVDIKCSDGLSRLGYHNINDIGKAMASLRPYVAEDNFIGYDIYVRQMDLPIKKVDINGKQKKE